MCIAVGFRVFGGLGIYRIKGKFIYLFVFLCGFMEYYNMLGIVFGCLGCSSK